MLEESSPADKKHNKQQTRQTRLLYFNLKHICGGNHTGTKIGKQCDIYEWYGWTVLVWSAAEWWYGISGCCCCCCCWDWDASEDVNWWMAVLRPSNNSPVPPDMSAPQSTRCCCCCCWPLELKHSTLHHSTIWTKYLPASLIYTWKYITNK